MTMIVRGLSLLIFRYRLFACRQRAGASVAGNVIPAKL